MSSRVLHVLAAAAVIVTVPVFTGTSSRGQAAPQAHRPGASSATPTEAAPFAGDWLVTLSTATMSAGFAVSISTDGDNVTATISADTQPAIAVTDFSLSGQSLVLRFGLLLQGNTVPAAMTLTPDGAGLRAALALMDGQFALSGTAARQAPGTTVRATGFSGVGGGRGAQTSEATDFSPKPPYRARTPDEQAASFILPAGYRLELVAAEPEVISPVAIEFDGNGRMYVAEMISYMMDAEATRQHDPISRITRWESTRGDGRYDKRTVFVDNMVAPRMILPLQDGVILVGETDSDDIVKWTDTDGDGVADTRDVVFTGIGQSGNANIEHQQSGLVWNMDNWIYTTYNPFRIRWTPSGFLREPTGPNGGQWGLGTDNDGKPWFVDAGGERGPMNFQFPIHYGNFTPCPSAGRGGRGGTPPAPPNPNCPPGMENGFEKDFAVVWPAPGIGDMQGGIARTRMPAQNLNHFTATAGPAIVRAHRLPADLQGDLLFTEPVGRLIRRAKVENVEGLTQLRNAYPGSEFITSVDQLFRPVNIGNAPDGTMYIADMYHGIIQERQWSGPGTYLRAKIEQYQLDKVASYGRIWRLRYDGRPAITATATNMGQPALPALTPDFAPPRMYSDSSARLVAHLSHPNGWWRDMAQRQLILRQDRSVVPSLQQILRSSDNLLARFHALWTLEGLDALDAGAVREAMEDGNPRMRVQAIRASETLYKAGDPTFADDYRRLTTDPDTNVVIQAMLTVTLFKTPDGPDVIRAAQAANAAKGVALIGERLLTPPPTFGGRGRRGGPLTTEEQQRLEHGSTVYAAVCFSCHGSDGLGTHMAGAPPGTMLGPALAGSLRVQGHRDYVISVLLKGLSGRIDDNTYPDVMVPMGGTDEWVAGIASYVRNSFGNSAGMVTPDDVARVRAASAARTTPWTLPELEATLPRLLDASQWKLTASHAPDIAVRATTLRGWSSGAPQTAGMWLTVELPEPALVGEVQFDSAVINTGRGGGRGMPGGAAGPQGRGAAPAPFDQAAAGVAAAAPAPPAPIVGYPRGYSVAVSTDGETWRTVAEGKGAGARTVVRFAPTSARFIRITQTDSVPNAPAWSVSNLRVYEAPAVVADR
jgi:mono/diheme cytochrome c family protein